MGSFLPNVHLLILLVTHQVFLGRARCLQGSYAAGSGGTHLSWCLVAQFESSGPACGGKMVNGPPVSSGCCHQLVVSF